MKERQPQGEGNYDAARRYDESAREFVRSGKVEQAARDVPRLRRRDGMTPAVQRMLCGGASRAFIETNALRAANIDV